jgi:hypothetical protein
MAANASPPRGLLARLRARGLGRPHANENAAQPGEEPRLEQTTAFGARGLGRPRANEKAPQAGEEPRLEQITAFGARHGLMPGSVAISAGSSRYSMSS